jgi:hypothetical protein
MTEPQAPAGPSADDLDLVTRTRTFFGHQSVGQNVLTGVAELYAATGRPMPPVEETLIGANEHPLGKIEDFAARLRAGTAERVDVAMMKLCYVDIGADTDIAVLFDAYRATLAVLERDFPHLAFVHVTVPLTTEPGGLTRLRARLTGGRPYGPAENAARERLNALVREEYGACLFDLAAVESTRPDGSRVRGEHGGVPYHALHDGYASDSGHLNAAGARVAAAAWVTAVADAARHREPA